MDRFAWTDGMLAPDEQLVVQQNGVKIYDGENKVLSEEIIHSRFFNCQCHCSVSSTASYRILGEDFGRTGTWNKKKKTWLYVDIYYIYVFCFTLFQTPVFGRTDCI